MSETIVERARRFRRDALASAGASSEALDILSGLLLEIERPRSGVEGKVCALLHRIEAADWNSLRRLSVDVAPGGGHHVDLIAECETGVLVGRHHEAGSVTVVRLSWEEAARVAQASRVRGLGGVFAAWVDPSREVPNPTSTPSPKRSG